MFEWNHRNKKEKLAQEVKIWESKPKITSSRAYGFGAVMAVGVLGLLGCYVYQRSSPGDNNDFKVTPVRFVETRTNKFEME